MVQRLWASMDPIFFVNDTGLACNHPGIAPPSYIPIKAGENLTAVYWYWLHPVGPMTVWLAECGESCENVDVNKLDFFKIWEAGSKLPFYLRVRKILTMMSISPGRRTSRRPMVPNEVPALGRQPGSLARDDPCDP